MKLSVQGREAYAYTGGKPFDPSLPTIVFVHGAVNDHTVWTLLARWCAHHGHGVLAVDLPGHMRSAGPALKSVEAMADWVLALLDAAGVTQAAIAGHSLGSLVALEVASRAPGRITRLVMLGTCVPMPVPQLLLDLAKTDVHAALKEGSDEALAWDRRVSLALVLADGKQLEPARAQAQRCLEQMGTPELRSLSQPVLFRFLALCKALGLGIDESQRQQAASLLPPRLRDQI